MNATQLASIMFPFDAETDRVIFYGTTMGYSATVLYSLTIMMYKMVKKCISKQDPKEVPFAKLSNVIVEPPKEHKITPE